MIRLRGVAGCFVDAPVWRPAPDTLSRVQPRFVITFSGDKTFNQTWDAGGLIGKRERRHRDAQRMHSQAQIMPPLMEMICPDM
jgi:hypothetical protein